MRAKQRSNSRKDIWDEKDTKDAITAFRYLRSFWSPIIPLCLTIVLVASMGSAATRLVQYVDPGATGTGDGSSWTDAFTHLKTWEAQDTNLVTADKYLEVYLRSTGGVLDNGAVTWSGWGTDATHYARMIEDPNNYHGGAWTAGDCYILVHPQDTYAIDIAGDDLIVDGLQIYGQDSTSRYGGIRVASSASRITLRNCIIRGYPKANGWGIVFNYGAVRGVQRYAYNNIIAHNYLGVRIWRTRAEVLNNTIVDNDTVGLQVLRSGAPYELDAVVQNNLLAGNTTADYQSVDAGGTLVLGCNYTGDATSPDGSGFRNTDVNFVNADVNDFHLHADMAGWVDDCTTQSAFATDIDGAARSHWDAGADEIVEGAEPPVPPPPPVHLNYYVSPTLGLDPVGGENQAEPNATVHDGESRGGAWKTLRRAVWLVPDAAGVTINLMEGDHGPCLIDRLSYEGYPERTQYVTVRPDPNNSGDCNFTSDRYWNTTQAKYAWRPALTISGDATQYVPVYLRFEDVNFTTDTNDTYSRYRDVCYGSENIVEVRAAHHLQIVDCNIHGVRGVTGTDNRPRSDYTTERLLSLNEVDSGTAAAPKTSNILVQTCTFKDGMFAIYQAMTSLGKNVEVLDNDISQCAANGMTSISGNNLANDWARTQPLASWPLWQGNYVHNQARIYNATYTGIVHGTGIAPTSGYVRVIGNFVYCYGGTAGIRNYPRLGPNPPPMQGLYLVNNLVINHLNYAMELYQLGSGSKVLHNTCIGIRAAGTPGTGRYYWGYPQGTIPGQVAGNYYPGSIACKDYGTHAPYETAGVQICNNIFLGFNSTFPPTTSVFPTGCIMTGNAFWSLSSGWNQTLLDAAWPGNQLYCTSTASPPAVDSDSNAVTFTTQNSFFDGGAGWATAFNGFTVNDANIYVPSGSPVAITHEFDLVEAAAAVDAGTALYTVATDYWGSARDTSPDIGYDESPADATPEDEEPNPPEPAVKPKRAIIRR